MPRRKGTDDPGDPMEGIEDDNTGDEYQPSLTGDEPSENESMDPTDDEDLSDYSTLINDNQVPSRNQENLDQDSPQLPRKSFSKPAQGSVASLA